MDLNFGSQFDAFREEVASFLKENWTTAPSRDPVEIASFRRKSIEAGYLYRAIPRQYGGSEQPADPIKARIIKEEFRKARAPGELRGPGPGMIVPTLILRGEEWQREKFVAPTLTGEISWCQGYSEPGAGSDLASLKSRAILEGDEWVINGQKVWTTNAHEADYMFILVRTEPDAPKHDGISYLLLDMQQDGVKVRPLRQITGGSEFNEVFLDDVRTPRDWIVGERGQGWSVSKSTLKFERDGIGAADTIEQQFQSLVALARDVEINGTPAIERTEIRQKLAEIEGYVMAQKYSSYRQMSMDLAGQNPGLITALGKLNGTQIAHRIALLAQTLLGEEGLVMPPSRQAGDQGRANAKWVNQIMGSLAMAIAGGTSNIQRNIIAERALGLPRT